MTAEISRGDLLRKGAIGVAISAGALVVPGIASADGPESVQVAEIYQLQAGSTAQRATRTST